MHCAIWSSLDPKPILFGRYLDRFGFTPNINYLEIDLEKCIGESMGKGGNMVIRTIGHEARERAGEEQG